MDNLENDTFRLKNYKKTCNNLTAEERKYL